MIIPWHKLNDDILASILKEYLLRQDIEDYIDKKNFEHRKQVLLQKIKLGELFILWSELDHTFDIKEKDFLAKILYDQE